MNNRLKYLLITCGAVALLLLAAVAWMVWSMDARNEQAQQDTVGFSRCCDTVRYVTEQPTIRFSGFGPEEIGPVQFQLLRAGEPTRDTVIAIADGYAQVPYPCFLKTDTIVVTIRDRQQYFISGYRHEAYLHYGMFGYVGSHDCRLADECFVNGRRSYGVIEKDTL